MKKRVPAILLALCLTLSLLPMAALAADSRQITHVQADLDTFGLHLGSPLPQAATKTPHVTVRTEWRYWPTQGGPMFQDMEPVASGTIDKAGYYWAQLTVIPDSGYAFAPDCGFTPFEGASTIPLAGSNPYLYAVMIDRFPLLDSLSLSSGTLQPSFSSGLFGTYRVDVAGEIDSITVTAAAQPGFSIQGDGVQSLNPGKNHIEITVTDDLGQHEPTTYTIDINRAQPGPVSVPSFTDVPAGEYYAEPVKWAVTHEPAITNGATDTTFAPGRNCTEAEILTFLWRAAGEPAEGAKTPVANVRESDYFYQAAMWANDMGMIDPGTFDPARPCTRSQAVKFIWAAFLTPEAPESGFTDVSAGADYAGAVSWAVANGITNGDGSDTIFSPDKVCTRAQIVTFLHRAYVPEARLTAN